MSAVVAWVVSALGGTNVPETEAAPTIDDGRQSGWGDPPVEMVPIEEIKRAAGVLDGVIVRTPLVPLHSYDGERDVWIKPETLQPIGSYKLRGVYFWAASLSEAERAKGLMTYSAGNTAQALGFVAKLFGCPSVSFCPDSIPGIKLDAMEAYGIEPRLMPAEDLFAHMLRAGWREEPYTCLHPWTTPEMITGHGTLGLEILADMPDVDTIYVAVGGGGMIAGVGCAIKQLRPQCRVIGVQPFACGPLKASFEAGTNVWVADRASIADGTHVPLVVDEMWPLLRQVVDDVVLVTETEVKDAVRHLALRNKLIAEGAGAMSVAAALKTPKAERGNTVCVLSGGGIDTDRLVSILDPR